MGRHLMLSPRERFSAALLGVAWLGISPLYAQPEAQDLPAILTGADSAASAPTVTHAQPGKTGSPDSARQGARITHERAAPQEAQSEAGAANGASAATPVPVPPETAAVTHHSVRLDGRSVAYTATAGNLLLRNDTGEAQASVFYVAYTADGKPDANRPVTFLFNGGPGASTIFLLIGSFGPRRAHTASPAVTPPAPYVLEDNPDSLIDRSDLVFIDAVGTGFSRIVGHATGKGFWSVDKDLDAFEQFIDRYLSVNQRWNAPKYLLGESYGTTRAAMLAYRLNRDGMALNGVMLMSSVLNYTGGGTGSDFDSESYLPTYAAAAWYHNRIEPKPASLPAFLDEVRAFSRGPYAQGLAAGDALADSERDALAQQVAHYTGISVGYVEQARLRIDPSRFRKQLLRAQSRSIGRYDARFEGIDRDDAGERPDYDPSEVSIASAYDAAFHQLLAQDLHFVTTERYRVLSDEVGRQWDWKHRGWRGDEQLMPYAAGDLAEAMRQNPHLQVLSLNGYYDLATPFFATEYDLAHLGLERPLRANVHLAYYPTGHMIYLDDKALHDMRGEIERFYDAASR